MEIAGIVILIFIGLWGLFLAVDGLGLTMQQGMATVLGHEHRDMVKGGRMDVIARQPMVVPYTTPEKYILKLEINGRQTEGTVSKSLFDAVQPGDRVQVTFQKRRLTGRVQILDVTR